MGGWVWPVGLYYQPQSQSYIVIWDLGLGFGTWILNLDLGLDLGLTIFFKEISSVNISGDHNKMRQFLKDHKILLSKSNSG